VVSLAKLTRAQAIKRMKEMRSKLSKIVDAGWLSYEDAAAFDKLHARYLNKVMKKQYPDARRVR